MKDFSGKIAVITGGGSGIGRALALQLTAEGCSVAMCDVSEAGLLETRRLALEAAPQGVRVTTHIADVSVEDQVLAFRDDAGKQHETDHIHLLFNNAGISGGGSFVTMPRENWDRTFNICWNGVYLNTRAFLPMMMKAEEAHLINVSSINGFWASLGPQTAHTAYSAAKFAVKGFSEALINDFRLNAPHIKVSVVMPGHIGTSIALNSMREFGLGAGSQVDPDQARIMGEMFRDNGLPPARAAQIILDGVREEKWRILVGDDAVSLDATVRANPEFAYSLEFGSLLEQARAARAAQS
jgi:NAD(P)-dependent dehydrogenase (short-subunit alcohol dehydrogenase family)